MSADEETILFCFSVGKIVKSCIGLSSHSWTWVNAVSLDPFIGCCRCGKAKASSSTAVNSLELLTPWHLSLGQSEETMQSLWEGTTFDVCLSMSAVLLLALFELFCHIAFILSHSVVMEQTRAACFLGYMTCSWAIFLENWDLSNLPWEWCENM